MPEGPAKLGSWTEDVDAKAAGGGMISWGLFAIREAGNLISSQQVFTMNYRLRTSELIFISYPSAESKRTRSPYS